jgi:glycosyltransferase involved in cell wall biosynthesis
MTKNEVQRKLAQIELSFIIPAFNEEKSIECSLSNIEHIVREKQLTFEIVVVDDGSKDKTLTRAMEYANKNSHTKVVSYPSNVGKGHAVKAGFLKTAGEIIVLADSDMEIDLTTVPSYIEALKDADLVIATKWHPKSKVNMPLHRRALSHGFNVLVRMLTGANLRDTQTGLKVMKKSAFINVFPRLCVKRYAFDVELLAVANLFGLKIVEKPVQLEMNSNFSPLEVWRMFVDLLGIAYRLRVTHFYQRQKLSSISKKKQL